MEFRCRYEAHLNPKKQSRVSLTPYRLGRPGTYPTPPSMRTDPVSGEPFVFTRLGQLGARRLPANPANLALFESLPGGTCLPLKGLDSQGRVDLVWLLLTALEDLAQVIPYLRRLSLVRTSHLRGTWRACLGCVDAIEWVSE